MKGSFPIKIQSDGGWRRVLMFRLNGAVYPLTSVTSVVMTITPRTGAPVVLSMVNGKVTVDGAGGTITFLLTKTEVAAFNWQTGNHEVLVGFSDPYAEAIQFNGPVSII